MNHGQYDGQLLTIEDFDGELNNEDVAALNTVVQKIKEETWIKSVNIPWHILLALVARVK